MSEDEFEDRLKALRPRLHRYCARMTGSAVNGEDVLQDTLVKALHARAQGAGVDNLEGWLFRIAHNTSLDFLRERSRNSVVPLTEDVEAVPIPEADIVAISFQTFLQLPELQRCAVILKDVLGHSVEEIASIAECSQAAAKSALQRGRAALRRLAQAPEDARIPLMSDSDRRKISAYVHLFQSGDFDAIRALLADDVKLDLVNRLQLEGRDNISLYFARYAEVRKWRFALGAVEGRPAMLVFDSTGPMQRPAHFVLIDWSESRIIGIRDFLFAPYVLEAVDWVRLGQKVTVQVRAGKPRPISPPATVVVRPNIRLDPKISAALTVSGLLSMAYVGKASLMTSYMPCRSQYMSSYTYSYAEHRAALIRTRTSKIHDLQYKLLRGLGIQFRSHVCLCNP